MKVYDDYELQERIAILSECIDERIAQIKRDDPGINHVHAMNRAGKQIKEQGAREIALREPDDGTVKQCLAYF